MAVDAEGWPDCEGRGVGTESGGGLNGSKTEDGVRWRKHCEGSRSGGRVARGDGAGRSERIKRKVCEAGDVSAAEAACLPQPLLALRPARSGVSSAELKTGILLPFVRRTPFPSFIYLCLSAADNARPALSRRLFFPLRLFHYSSAGQFTLVARRTCALRCSWFWPASSSLREDMRHPFNLPVSYARVSFVRAHCTFPARPTVCVAYKILFTT